MNIIKDWIFAIKVCKKYGIKWNPFKKHDCAEFEFTYWYEYKKYESVIKISPFYPKFIDSFMHEVGHCLYHRKLYMKSENHKEYEANANYFKLKDEYLAWRFAKLVLKQRFDKNRARNMFKTYFPSQAKKHGSLITADKYADFDYRLSK